MVKAANKFVASRRKWNNQDKGKGKWQNKKINSGDDAYKDGYISYYTLS